MAQKNNISVVIYVHNDQKNVARAVESANLLTSTVIVIDIGSTDDTARHAEEAGAEVVKTKFHPYVELVRMEGLKKVKTDWVFILDSDEVITQALAEEIRSHTSEESLRAASDVPAYSAYRVPRKNMFACLPSGRASHKWLKHGGWWPDYQTRLIRLKDLTAWSTRIHSTPEIKGNIGLLKEPLVHYSHGDFSEMVKKTLVFEGMESDLLHAAHKKVSTATFFRKFFGELYRRLIRYKGFLDGKEGFAESIYQAYSKTITYLLLYEKEKRRTL